MAEQTIPVRVKHTLGLGENAFWLAIWTMAACALLGLIGILAWHDLREDEILAKTPAPLELACATSNTSRVHPACMALGRSDHR